MEQLKSEQIRVQAEERRKTLSEETRQHQAVRDRPHRHGVTGTGALGCTMVPKCRPGPLVTQHGPGWPGAYV